MGKFFLVLDAQKEVDDEDIKRFLMRTKFDIFLFKTDTVKRIFTKNSPIYNDLLPVFDNKKIKYQAYEKDGYYIIDLFSKEETYLHLLHHKLLNRRHCFRFEDEDYR